MTPTGISNLTPADAHVLYAEDEIIIALDTAQLLEDMGFSNVVVVHNLRRAETIAATKAFDLALLDVNLGGGDMSLDLGRQLIAQGVQVVFATGYNSDEMEAEHPDLVFIEKPLTMEAVSAAVGRTTPAGTS